MERCMRGLSGVGLIVALLIFGPAPGGLLQGRARGAEPTVEDLKKEVAELRELLKWQGIWKKPDGSQMIIEGARWIWLSDGKTQASGTLKIVEVGAKQAKVELVHLTGSLKGSTAKAIVHARGGDTLQYNGSFDNFPKEFEKGSAFKRIPR